MQETKKTLLSEQEMPRMWYNILADMTEKPLPALYPESKKPVTADDLRPIFPDEIIQQELSEERFIEIPAEVRKLYQIWRPTPVVRAYGLEQMLDTPAKIYYKNESSSPIGSHKLNTAIPQAYYNAQQGVRKLATETGGGQWGSALSFACNHFNIDLQIFMVKCSYHQKPYRKSMMQIWGADVIPSPSMLTQSGREALAIDSECNGSLGIAISEAVEQAVTSGGSVKYALGSVLNHVLLHQTIIGEEARLQMEKIGNAPDVIIGCFGGGSNFAGIAFPFLRDKLQRGTNVRAIAVEPQSCPKLTRGIFHYDYGDTQGLTPILPMYTLGSGFQPADIHAGGLRYHGAGSIVSQLLKSGVIEAAAIPQLETFQAATLFARAEGIIPAPESAHAIAQTIREAKRAKEQGLSPTILFNLSGHGLLDMYAYQQYYDGKLQNYQVSDSEIQQSLDRLTCNV